MSLLEVAVEMSGDETDGEVAPVGATYIRGGQGAATSDRNVGRVVVWFCLISLAGVIVALTVGAVRHDLQTNRLHTHGIPVAVSVGNCLALASGTGMTSDGYRCQGTYTYSGRRYSEVIRNSTALRRTGDTITGVVDPSQPSVMSLASAVRSTSGEWKAYIVPAVLFVLLDIGVAVIVVRSRRRRT